MTAENDNCPDQLPDGRRFGLGGFDEVEIVAADVAAWIELLREVGGYESAWQDSEAGRLEQCLLLRPPARTGRIRLRRLAGVRSPALRDGARVWDSGGIFDLDLRVQDLDALCPRLRRRGWKGFSDPVNWRFGELHIREWLAAGPDGVVLALIERLAPPLTDWYAFEGFSHVFNSTQIVRAMEPALAFYRALGFRTVVDQCGPLPGRGGEMLGLDPALAATVPVRLVIVHPQGSRDGSVELLSFEPPTAALAGRELKSRSQVNGRGLNRLRFPVLDLDGFAAWLARRGMPIASPGIKPGYLEPYGPTRRMTLCSPDGALLEFYQRVG